MVMNAVLRFTTLSLLQGDQYSEAFVLKESLDCQHLIDYIRFFDIIYLAHPVCAE